MSWGLCAALFALALLARAWGGDGVASNQRSLTWEGDKDGLMSHFLQLKIYYLLAAGSGRTLFVSPIFSMHYGNRPTHLCDVFDLSAQPEIRCLEGVVEGPCSLKLSPALLASVSQHVCYKGPLPTIFGAVNRKESVLRAVNLTNVPLVLNARYAPLVSAAKKALGVGGGKKNYTVAHWRRGDQLRTRCKAARDMSVNCGRAVDLVRAVRRLSSDEVVYVATNEPPSSAEYQALQKAGFVLFSSLRAFIVAANGGQDLTLVDAFALELALMLDASTFLGWGLTEIKDVVEYERSRLKRSFCLTSGQDNAVANTFETGTWCGVHSGKYGFKNAYSAAAWAPHNASTVQASAGGIIDKAAAGGVATAFTNKAEGGDEQGGEEAHIAAAQEAQKTFFQPLSAPKNNVITGTGQKAADGRDKRITQPRGGTVQQHKHHQSGKSAPSTPPVQGPKVDPADLQHYLSVLASIKDGGRLPKKVYSDRLRVLFVAGLEGTGHHALAAMLSVCLAERGPRRCHTSPAIDGLLCFTHHNAKHRFGLFNVDDSARAAQLVGELQAGMRNLSATAETQPGDASSLYVLGLGFSNGVGMLSYPNFGGANKALNHPDVFLLAAVAERAGVDLRVLVLQRSAGEIVRSVAARGYGSTEDSRILIDNAAALASQLRLLDRGFFLCLDYPSLMSMRDDIGLPGVRAKRDALGGFLMKDGAGPLLDAMLRKVKPSGHGSNSTTAAAAGGAAGARGVNGSSTTARLPSANAALGEFLLESRVALIRDECKGVGGV